MTAKQVFYDTRPYIFEGLNRKGEPRKRYGCIKVCKSCGKEFFTPRDVEFCSNHCSSRYKVVVESRDINGELVHFTDNNECFITYNDGIYRRKRYGKIKSCEYCNKEFFTAYDCTFCSKVCAHSKENHYNWKGGKNPIHILIRSDPKYNTWRSNVYQRDSYTCQVCDNKNGGKLVAHHKLPLNRIISQFSIKTLEDAYTCNAIWDIENGVTMCKDCHKEHHHEWGY